MRLVKKYESSNSYAKTAKDTIEIWTPKFRLNGVFIIKLSIYAAFRGRIFFLPAGLKTENLKFFN